MAEYNMQELNLPGEDGKRILYPRMKLYGQVDLETITEKIAYASSFTRGDIIGLVQAITDEIAYQMGQGYSVKIDNLGVFTPALGLRQDRERETGEEGDTKRNAVSICLKDIHFKVDKELLYRTARHCHLKCSTDKFPLITYAPVNDPEIAIGIVIESGDTGVDCAPVAAEIYNQYFSGSESAMDLPQEGNTLLQ